MRRGFILAPSCAPTMPNKRVSADIDHVPVDPKPWTLPAYEPIAFPDDFPYGQSQLPVIRDRGDRKGVLHRSNWNWKRIYIDC